MSKIFYSTRSLIVKAVRLEILECNYAEVPSIPISQAKEILKSNSSLIPQMHLTPSLQPIICHLGQYFHIVFFHIKGYLWIAKGTGKQKANQPSKAKTAVHLNWQPFLPRKLFTPNRKPFTALPVWVGSVARFGK